MWDCPQHIRPPVALHLAHLITTDTPPARLMQFFTALYACLRNPSRAVFQFYPETDDQIQLITSIARRAGFGGGIVVDYPNSKKARKVFLVLMVGSGRYAGAANANANRMDVDGAENGMPRALEDGDDAEAGAEARRVVFERRREKWARSGSARVRSRPRTGTGS
jgi:18S rRNA (guanine1575-N7)-methyltransferase